MVKSTKPVSATTFKQTAFGTLPRSKVVELEAKGVKKALDHIVKLASQKPKLTPQVILNLHKVGFGFIFPDWAGKFRTIDVTVGDYEPPHFSRVPMLITNLCKDLDERLKHLPAQDSEEEYLAGVISLLAWFQHRFVLIHPFNDYNGRVARLLTNFLILNLDFPLVEIKADTGKDRDNYVEAMKAADNHDLSRLENLIAISLKESLEKLK